MLALAKKEEATLAPWILHDLRRTAITGMADLGIEPHVIEAVVNHISGSKAGVTITTVVSTRRRRQTLARWAQHLQGGGGAANVGTLPKRRG